MINKCFPVFDFSGSDQSHCMKKQKEKSQHQDHDTLQGEGQRHDTSDTGERRHDVSDTSSEQDRRHDALSSHSAAPGLTQYSYSTLVYAVLILVCIIR